jgi:uncharacterized membrane protein (Fun14 family)
MEKNSVPLFALPSARAGVAFAIGNMCTLWGLVGGSVAMVHTIKSLEPGFVLLFQSLLIAEPVSVYSALSMGLATAGSLMFSYRDPTWVLSTALICFAANVGFGLQKVFSKLLMGGVTGDTSAVLMLRMSVVSTTMFSCALCVLAFVVPAGPHILVPLLAISPKLLLCAFLHATYQMSSMVMLYHVSVLSHTALNLAKRGLMIGTGVIAGVWAGYVPAARDMLGIAALAIGLAMFQHSRLAKGCTYSVRSANVRRVIALCVVIAITAQILTHAQVVLLFVPRAGAAVSTGPLCVHRRGRLCSST